jgi:hypothetical protein
VVIYHFMRRTLQIIINKDVKEAHKFQPFLDAQIRMIKVSVLAFIVQMVVLAILEAFPLGGFFPLLAIGVEAMLLGYAFAYKYNELFDLTI